jgi:large conductance mechanosensitive channel
MTSSSSSSSSFINEFVKFLKTFGIIGLALALVIGQVSSSLVSSLVDDIINPLVGLFLPAGNLNDLSVMTVNIFGALSVFKIGHLISEIINFVIIVLVIFAVYKVLSRFHIVSEKDGGDKLGSIK